ncbi:MAG: radical SAM protein [Candidatus Saccharicenans sp.]|jgi:putative pyruvate formate lyase activating enzyme|nr:radical SAM protein [Candidatus Saccharicenans sp.]MDH7492574.1 radical SAM protein [Candidatus Saccharicenans sp.]
MVNRDFFLERKLESVDRALARLAPLEADCTLCPRECHVNRTRGQTGVCQTGSLARVSVGLLHFGEEPVLSGRGLPAGARGSGTIFFTGCNLKCLFCQNFQLSWLNEGQLLTDDQLASLMLELQGQGALNVNLVSPTHVILPILRALRLAYQQGLSIPLVYNSNGYDSLEVVELLRGIVDIYLPDLKYVSSELSRRYSSAPDYFDKARQALQEMYCQQPDLVLDDREIARQGLIIRHLVLPGAADDSIRVLEWIAGNLSTSVGLSLMSQYHPCYKAPAEIQREITREEYHRVMEKALDLGFENLFLQPEPFEPDEHLVPDFRRKQPFRWKN